MEKLIIKQSRRSYGLLNLLWPQGVVRGAFHARTGRGNHCIFCLCQGILRAVRSVHPLPYGESGVVGVPLLGPGLYWKVDRVSVGEQHCLGTTEGGSDGDQEMAQSCQNWTVTAN